MKKNIFFNEINIILKKYKKVFTSHIYKKGTFFMALFFQIFLKFTYNLKFVLENIEENKNNRKMLCLVF